MSFSSIPKRKVLSTQGKISKPQLRTPSLGHTALVPVFLPSNCLGSREVWFVFELVVVGSVKNGKEKLGIKVKPQISRGQYIICK